MSPAPPRERRTGKRYYAATAVALATLGLAACGGEERRDANEPESSYEVEVTKAKFPTKQRLGQTTNLVLGVENTGSEELPELAITIFTDEGADGAFSIHSDQPGLANPNRPVWILENKFPREVGQAPPKGLSPATRAQTNTFGFGSLPAGEGREVVWRVTPVKRGNYTVNYQIAAGLEGKAKAVTADGSEPAGDFAVTISGKPPHARVGDNGEVIIEGR